MREEAIGQHRGGAAAAFFRRLTHQHQRAVPAVAVFGHPARRSAQADM